MRTSFTKGHIDDKSLRKISRSKCSFFPMKFRFELMGTVTVLHTDADVTMPLIDLLCANCFDFAILGFLSEVSNAQVFQGAQHLIHDYLVNCLGLAIIKLNRPFERKSDW